MARLLGRGDRERELVAERRLDQDRDQLQAAAGQLEQARADLAAVLRTRLADLLEERPDVAGDLQALVGQIQAELPAGVADDLADEERERERRRRRRLWRDALRPVPGIVRWYKANAVAGTLLAAGFVVLKGYVLARGDITTALGILQYAGLATVVTAGLLSSLPILAAAMLAYTVSRMITAPAARLAGVMLGALVLSAVFTPWTYLAVAAGLGLLIGVMRALTARMSRKPRPGGRVPGAPSVATWLVVPPVAVVVVVAVISMLYTVWAPHEIVSFRPHTVRGGLPVVGYVLSEDNGWITILTSGEHEIVRFPDARVTTQVICEKSPRPGHVWSEVSDASTLWDKVTGDFSILYAWHPTANMKCPNQVRPPVPAGRVHYGAGGVLAGRRAGWPGYAITSRPVRLTGREIVRTGPI